MKCCELGTGGRSLDELLREVNRKWNRLQIYFPLGYFRSTGVSGEVGKRDMGGHDFGGLKDLHVKLADAS